MDSRLELDENLANVLDLIDPDGDRHTYFNPPSSVRIRIPAIRYSIRKLDSTFANNGRYNNRPSYEVTLIDDGPDSKYVEKIMQIPYCSFDRHYVADNLNHFVFTIYKP